MNAAEQKQWDSLDPIVKLDGLVSLANQAQAQLAGAIKIIKSRDRQIEIALDALVQILNAQRGCKKQIGWRGPCDHCVAMSAIESMRMIHKESEQA